MMSIRQIKTVLSGRVFKLLSITLVGLLLSTSTALAIKDGQTFQDWNAKCEKTPDGKSVQCFIFQTLVDEEAKQPVLQTVIGYLQGGEPALIFTVPLGVALRAGLGLQIDDGETMRVPFENCNPVGCVAGLPLDNKLIGSLKRGLGAKIMVVDGRGQRITLELSLKGFTAGFNALKEKPELPPETAAEPTKEPPDTSAQDQP